MKLIHTNDDTHYRRWVNLIPSLLFPGSAQFLSGRKSAGIIWFVFYFLLVAGKLCVLTHPKTTYSIVQMGPFEWLLLPFWLFIAAESLRRPIPCLGFRGWAVYLVVCLGVPITLLCTVRAFLVQPFKVPDGSMQPTIMGNRKDTEGNPISGDHIFANKFIYRFSEPQRGDIIVFRTKGINAVKLDTYYVKRLAGLPGEKVSIEPPYLLINGNKVTEPGIFKKIAEGMSGGSGFCLAKPSLSFRIPLDSTSSTITLGPDEYLVLGDNTQNSFDGRYFGPIKRAAILGKAFYIYAPTDRKKRIE